MTAPEPPAVAWSPSTTVIYYGRNLTDAPADAVRLVPDAHEVECPSCGATIRARMADAPTEDEET